MTAKRATNQIVRATAAQVLAEVATLAAVGALVAATREDAQPVGLPVVPRVDLMVPARVPEQIALVETVLRRIVRAATATGRTLRALRAMVIRARVATVIRALRAPVETVPIPPDLRAMVMHAHVAPAIRVLRAPAETDPIHLVPHGTEIRVHHGALVTDLTRRAHLEMVIHVHVVMATVLGVRPEPAEIDPIQLDRHATGMRVHVAMANDPTLHARPVMATAHIPRDHRATARARIAPMAIARAPIVLGMTGLAQTGRGAIDLTATDPAATGSPRAVNDVRSVRR